MSVAPVAPVAPRGLGRRRRVRVRYEPRGAAREAFTRRDPELVLAGPAGTGKTVGALQKLHLCASKYAGMRGLIARKTLASLTASALVTYTERVLHPLDAVTFFGGSALEPPHFRYPNGSKLVVGGLDRATKIMSSEYDLIYVNEALEATEEDWENLTTRARYGVMPYQQVMADCNPGPPAHWLKLRSGRGDLAMLDSRHEDNPRLHDGRDWTVEGRRYIATLDALTGVRKLRLRYGIWAAAEGMVYEDAWERARNVVDRFEVPRDWPRYWVIDFGYTNPFVWQQWAEDPDGRLYREREIYMTRRLVTDHATDVLTVTGWRRTERGLEAQRPDADPLPVAVICDHDAEDRATFERATGLPTLPAYKAVSPGIQATAARMLPAGDGRPRLMFLRDALVERDEDLAARAKPTTTEDEVEGYIWDVRAGRVRGEAPVKDDDHGMDATRYIVAFVDSLADEPFAVDELVLQDEGYAVTIGPRY